MHRKCERLFGPWFRYLVVATAIVGIATLAGEGSASAGSGEILNVTAIQLQLGSSNDAWAADAVRIPGASPAAAIAVPMTKHPLVYFDNAGLKRVSVLVYMNPTLTKQSVQRKGVRTFTATMKGTVKYEYGAVMPNVLNIRDYPESQIDALRKMAGVSKVELDEYHPNVIRLDEATPLVRGLQSQLTAANLPYDGTGIRVCIVDTGIDMDNVMYASRIDAAASFDFNNNDSNPDDDNGHGSHVAGISVGGTGITVNLGCDGVEPLQGMAPNATLIGAKVLNSAGGGTDSNIIAGINHCADQSATGGRADVINLSIGTGNFTGTCDSHSWAVASNNAVAAGVVVVAASGNECNSNSMGSPACGSSVIAVGATYKAAYPNCEDATSNFNWGCCTNNSPGIDSIVCFSNQSDLLDVSAPGSVILSASNAAGGMSLSNKSGTSMASPMVAGLSALILDADPTLTPAEVRQILRDGATDMGAPGFDRAYGYGRIDAINTLSLVTPCINNTDCNDGDACTTDVCNTGTCSNTPISCPTGQTCNGGVCEGQGACCTGTACAIDSPSNCATAGGSYLGDGSVCGSGTAGNPTIYSAAPGVAIPDGGGAGNAATDTINVPDTFTIGDLNVDVTISHTWVGDVTVTISHLGTTVSIVDRPGVPGSTYGCSLDNFSGILLDDEGTGGTMEAQCAANLTSPPNYTPNNSLSAFDGMDAAGIWTITVYDSVSADSGTLNSWSLHIDAQGSNPCVGGCTNNAQCDDGVFCNGAETCVSTVCVPGTVVNCNDGVGCTDDSCNEATTSCDNIVNNANCDNGLFCDGSETCDAALDCQAGTAVNCNDGVGCTMVACNETTNSCDNTTNDLACDDGIFCNGAETCDAALDCQSGSAVNCNDGVGCTDDSCNETTNSCDNIVNNANCDNGLFCDGVETCDAALDCQAGTAVNCNDGVGCTDDSCNEATNSCDNVVNDANCDNGLFCDGSETCNAVSDCQAGSNPCFGQACDEGTNTCVACVIDGDCDDGLFCNGIEACVSNTCVGGNAVDCNDGVGCTTDSCNEGTASCDNVTNDAACNNGLFCDGVETCDAALDCQAGVSVDCNDGVGCTTDTCNEATNSCDSVANNAACDNGLFCDGVETCDAALDCQAGISIDCNDGVGCTNDACNEATNSCDNTANDANCGNGIFCDGAETCDAINDCQVGAAVNCNDGVGCTTDSCNEGTSSCDNIASNAACDDGLFCNGSETCDAALDCQAGASVNCNDGVGCTTDSCNEATNSCDNITSNAACDDGVFCNGSETCDAALDCLAGGDPCPGQVCDEATTSCVACNIDGDCDDGLFCNGSETCVANACVAGTAVNCNDGVGCTSDSCNEATNSCDNIASDAACSDGLFCNGVETCDAVLDCQAGTAINCNDGVGCTTDSCNEATNNCDNVASNAACNDGLFCNGSETCDATLDCQAGTSPCTGGQTCDEGTQTCTTTGCVIDADCDDGNACTVDTCTASVCSNDCATAVSALPYSENFDAGLGLWTNTAGDVFDWTRRSGTTPSSNTGPSGDHTSGSGFYMYTETSSPRAAGDTAIFEGPCMDLSGASSSTMTFWYNMNGASMGTLDAEVSSDCVTWTNAFTLSGNQGNTWFQATIDLTPYVGASSVKVRFIGTRGSSWQGDIAIDDIDVTMVAAANCTLDAQCDDGNVCTDDACIANVCQNTNNSIACNDGLFCNGADVCQSGTCTPVTSPGVANGTFDSSASWTSLSGGGAITFPGNLNVVGADAGSASFTMASQSGVTVTGANLEFDLLSYSSGDTGGWDYPVFHLNGTYYGLNSNGTLGATTTGGNGNGGTVDNAGQVTVSIHYIVNIDTLAGNAGPHTIGFGVHTADGGFGAGTAVFDTAIPAGGAIDPCPGQTCDEANNVCVP